MKYLNVYIHIAVIAYLVYTALAFVAYPDEPVLYCIVAGVVLVCLAGVFLIVAGLRRAGSWILFIGSIPLIPLGILGMVGGRKVLDALSEEAFQKRKEQRNVGAA
ncbi:MAG: hypothetical protein R6V10_17130 [bacterium]